MIRHAIVPAEIGEFGARVLSVCGAAITRAGIGGTDRREGLLWQIRGHRGVFKSPGPRPARPRGVRCRPGHLHLALGGRAIQAASGPAAVAPVDPTTPPTSTSAAP